MNPSPTAPPSLTKKKGPTWVVIVVALIAAAVGAVVGKSAVERWMNRGEGAARFKASWTKQTFTDITFEAPLVLGPGPDITAKLPEQVRDMLEYMELRDSGDSYKGFRISVCRFAYKTGVTVSLDGAVDGAMTQAAAALGVVQPKFKVEPGKVDGLDSRRAVYRGNIAGRPIQIDGLFVQRGQQFWQVQVIAVASGAALDAERILDSAHIAATP
jgi:hypothetical protein